MSKYYRNGKAVALPDTPKRSIGLEPKWVGKGRTRTAVCQVCGESRVQSNLATEYDPVMQKYVPITICKGCAAYVPFQNIPETGLWESRYWTGAKDTTGYSISSGIPVEYIAYNPVYPCTTRVFEGF